MSRNEYNFITFDEGVDRINQHLSKLSIDKQKRTKSNHFTRRRLCQSEASPQNRQPPAGHSKMATTGVLGGERCSIFHFRRRTKYGDRGAQS